MARKLLWVAAKVLVLGGWLAFSLWRLAALHMDVWARQPWETKARFVWVCVAGKTPLYPQTDGDERAPRTTRWNLIWLFLLLDALYRSLIWISTMTKRESETESWSPCLDFLHEHHVALALCECCWLLAVQTQTWYNLTVAALLLPHLVLLYS